MMFQIEVEDDLGKRKYQGRSPIKAASKLTASAKKCRQKRSHGWAGAPATRHQTADITANFALRVLPGRRVGDVPGKPQYHIPEF
jgi:hypothetical protein